MSDKNDTYSLKFCLNGEVIYQKEGRIPPIGEYVELYENDELVAKGTVKERHFVYYDGETWNGDCVKIILTTKRLI